MNTSIVMALRNKAYAINLLTSQYLSRVDASRWDVTIGGKVVAKIFRSKGAGVYAVTQRDLEHQYYFTFMAAIASILPDFQRALASHLYREHYLEASHTMIRLETNYNFLSVTGGLSRYVVCKTSQSGIVSVLNKEGITYPLTSKYALTGSLFFLKWNASRMLKKCSYQDYGYRVEAVGSLLQRLIEVHRCVLHDLHNALVGAVIK